MKVLRAVLLVVLVISNALASAADYVVSICDLQSQSVNDIAYLRPCDGWVSKNGCNNNWVAFDMSQYQGKSMYSTALAALMGDKAITLRLDGVSCLGYDETTVIRITK